MLTSRTTGTGAKPALVVVDASLGFTDPESPLGADFTPQIARINTLLDHAHARGWPVFLSTVVYHRDDEAPVFREKLPDLNLLAAGSRWVKIDPRLDIAQDDRVFEKTYASGFHRTALDAWLQAEGIDTVIITGFTTSGCVRATAVDALQHDYRTVVVSDAVGDRDADAHDANLRDLGRKYADVTSSGNLLVGPSKAPAD